jgi:NAD(P)-dependent dehydrogenase (short-subunit alcohol dehydrogenase family)
MLGENNLFNISNKIIIITGGTGVLGSSLAKYLITQGSKIVIIGRNKETLNILIDNLNKISNDHAIGFSCNVLNKDELETIKEKVLNKWKKIDVLINAAGGNMPGATIGPDQTIFDLNMSDFREVSELNLDGSVIPSLVFGKVMGSQGFGNIINVSSMTANSAITRVVGYSTSKSAINIFTKWMATEMALKFNEKIRVNAIAPGFFITNQNRELLTNTNGSYTERGEAVINKTPMKRFGNEKELNGTVHWLISEASSFVTGTIIPVDGGFSAFSGV